MATYIIFISFFFLLFVLHLPCPLTAEENLNLETGKCKILRLFTGGFGCQLFDFYAVAAVWLYVNGVLVSWVLASCPIY